MKKLYFTVLILVSGYASFAQQDRNISQWYYSNALYNPAAVATGEEDLSFFTNFRSQWLTIPTPGIGMRTNTLVAEFKVPDGFKGSNNFGVGLVALNEQTGDAKFSTINVNIPINYSLTLDKSNRLTVGISPGFYQQSTNRNAQTWESGWLGYGFLNNEETEIGLNQSYASIDLGLGAFYQHTTRNKTRIFGGLSLNHITRQKINFSFGGDRIYMQSVFQAGADISTSKKDLRLQPNLIFSRAGSSNNLILGMTLEHILKDRSEVTTINKTTCFNYGFYYRHRDALITSIGFKVKGVRMGLCFDANLSYLSQATSSVGAVEVYFKTMLLYRKSSTRTKLK